MKTTLGRRKREAGQAAVLVLVAMSIFLLGAVGLAIDGSHMFAQRQMAQAAADAAAEAGIMSIFNGTNTSGTHQFPTTGPLTCASSDQKTPCYFAQTLNGFNSATDTVTVDFPTAADVGISPSSLSSSDPVNLLRVTVQRTIDTTLIRFLGPATSTIRATGTAAILDVMSPVPIIVLHPTMNGSFSKNGGNDIIICGGPTRSIQVNSRHATALNIDGNGKVDLSHAGPLDPGNCTTGTGADFGSSGEQSTYPGTLLLGSRPGRYAQPASPIKDPLLGMSPPSQPAAPGGYVVWPAGQHGCPSTLAPSAECRVYSPGYYATGIQLGTSNKVFALFRPGIYYINHGGFHLNSNSIVRMAVSPDNSDPATGTGWTEGMLIYNSPASPVNTSNDIFEITSNSGQVSGDLHPSADCPAGGNCLVGANGGNASSASSYYGTLFFQNRGVATTLNHSLSGGGGLSIKGTLYMTHTAAGISADGTYQSLSLQGNSGSATKVIGEIIVDVLSLGGSSNITMNLSGLPAYTLRQVALVK